MQLFLLLLALATAAASTPVDEADQSLLWGPYRPNLYFGIRPRLPQSLMTGLIWFSTANYQSVQSTFAILARGHNARVLTVALQGSRHACEQDDRLDSYTWTQYDPREGGIQEIKDSQNNVKIITEFLKVPGGKNGGSWAARIKGEPMVACESEWADSIWQSGDSSSLQQTPCISLRFSTLASRVSAVLRCRMSRYLRSVMPSLAGVWKRTLIREISRVLMVQSHSLVSLQT